MVIMVVMQVMEVVLHLAFRSPTLRESRGLCDAHFVKGRRRSRGDPRIDSDKDNYLTARSLFAVVDS